MVFGKIKNQLEFDRNLYDFIEQFSCFSSLKAMFKLSAHVKYNYFTLGSF